MSFSAYTLTGTIFEEKTSKDTFLDPWTSLFPKNVWDKIKPDVLVIFDAKGREIELTRLPHRSSTNIGHPRNDSCCDFPKFPFWALVFPKRSYVPPQYPHLQLWYLDTKFAPSINFLDEKQLSNVSKIAHRIRSKMDRLSNAGEIPASFPIISYNSTPFSFYKDNNGDYIGGGQSVRTFHFHILSLPKHLDKIILNPEQIPNVYPTNFTHELFKLIFRNKQIQKSFFGKEDFNYETDIFGIEFEFNQGWKNLINVLSAIDRLFYSLQLRLIMAFYQDSESFIEKITDLITDKEKGVASKRKKVVLFGKERNLTDIKTNFVIQMEQLFEEYLTKVDHVELQKIGDSLVLNKKGDLSSTVDGQVIELRPGLGYGCIIKMPKSGVFHVHINPLDTANSKGVMEASGYCTTNREQVSQKPKWITYFTNLNTKF